MGAASGEAGVRCGRARWVVAGGLGAFLAASLFFSSFPEPWTLRGDNRSVIYPANLEAFRSWARGSPPEWSSGLWAGYPLLADPSSGSLYWPNLPFFLATWDPHLRAFDLSTAFHAGLLVAGSTCLLLVLGACPAAALFGGLLALLSPLACWIGASFLANYAPLAWWPWVFVAAEGLARGDPGKVCLPMALGWMALATQAFFHPEFALYSGVVSVAWLLTRRTRVPLRRRLARATLLGAGALALAAPVLIPAALYQPGTLRAGAVGIRAAAFVSLGPADLASLVLPERAAAAPLPAFIGAAALLLSMGALAGRGPRTLFLWILGVTGYLLALGSHTPLYGALHSLPPFDRFRNPTKLFLLTELAFAWLAALGADRILRGRRSVPVAVIAGLLMLAAAGERAACDRAVEAHPLLRAGERESLATLRGTLEGSGLLEQAARRGSNPPPRILETLGAKNLTMLYGLESLAGGGVPLIPRPHNEILARYLPNRFRPAPLPGRAELDLYGVRLVLAPPRACRRARSRGLVVVERHPGSCLAENPHHPRRYVFVRRARAVGSVDDMIALVKTDPGGPVPIVAPPELVARHTGPGAEGPVPEGPGREGRVEVRSYRPGRARLLVESPEPAFLLVRESWVEGWRIEVDGRRVRARPAAGLFFAVPLEAGPHRVELRYRTPGFRAGLVLCGLWVLGAGTWCGWSRRAGRERRERPEPGDR